MAEQVGVLSILPQMFDQDYDEGPCPDCVSRGLVVGDDGSFAVCACMGLDRWAVAWIENVVNRLVGRVSA